MKFLILKDYHDIAMEHFISQVKRIDKTAFFVRKGKIYKVFVKDSEGKDIEEPWMILDNSNQVLTIDMNLDTADKLSLMLQEEDPGYQIFESDGTEWIPFGALPLAECKILFKDGGDISFSLPKFKKSMEVSTSKAFFEKWAHYSFDNVDECLVNKYNEDGSNAY